MAEGMVERGRFPSILVVDDDYHVRHAVSQTLKHEGYDVTLARDGSEALTKFENKNFGMVITDLRMPKTCGMELLAAVKERSPETAVVMVTAYGEVEEAVEAMRRGASEFLVKPFPVGKLEEVVKKILWKDPRSSSSLPPLGDVWRKFNGKAYFVSQDPKTKEVEQQALIVAATDATVLIQGESGTGKELLARFIYYNSDRRGGSLVAVNCAALHENLLESELFGHERGAFTGAVARREGKFELANRGVLLLDEISEMQMSLQAKLLRAIQEKEVDRIGGKSPIPVDVRIVATTNKDLSSLVETGQFREDLYYRLKVVTLTLPPLRERQEDIPALAEFFLRNFSKMTGKRIKGFTKPCMDKLLSYPWQGNIRELENAVMRAVIFCTAKEIGPEEMDVEGLRGLKKPELKFAAGLSVREMEKRLIFKTLEATRGNRTKAARMLDVSLRTLRNKLRAYREEDGTPMPGDESFGSEEDKL
jgi:DNA-binding NtrC family response regulator